MPTRVRTALSKRRSPRRRFDHGEPIARPNYGLTVFIWAALAMIVLGLTTPRTHALVVHLPMPLPADYLGPLTPATNRLSLDAQGTIRWNSREVTQTELGLILEQVRELSPQPTLMFHPDHDVRYEDALRLLAIVDRYGVVDGCFRFSEIARYSDYENPPDFQRLITPDHSECDFAYH